MATPDDGYSSGYTKQPGLVGFVKRPSQTESSCRTRTRQRSTRTAARSLPLSLFHPHPIIFAATFLVSSNVPCGPVRGPPLDPKRNVPYL